MWNPAAWFVGIYRWVAGDERAVFSMLAARGALAGMGMVALTMIFQGFRSPEMTDIVALIVAAMPKVTTPSVRDMRPLASTRLMGSLIQ